MVKKLFRTSGIRLVLKAARNIRFDKRHLRRRNISSLDCRINNVQMSYLPRKVILARRSHFPLRLTQLLRTTVSDISPLFFYLNTTFISLNSTLSS